MCIRDRYLEDATVATDRSDAQGMASIKTAPGTYRLDVSPQFQVLRITEARDQGVLVNAVTLAARAPSELRGFLHEISIEANDISMMGLSGIGFAPRNGTDLKGPSRGIPGNDPKAALLAYLDAALLNLALTPLLRATDPVRDLVIRGNRLHHNLRNPFDDALLADAQFIGRGGVSLALVEAARISGNHIHENGPRAVDPVCGIFVGYGDNLEITDNQLAANGATTTGFEENRNAGIRGGLYLRFAGALTSHLSTSSGRHAALRVHDNRIDQPAGRALTAFAFGPVSVANNHFNSEFSGQFGFLDTMVGGVLILNLGGIHRLLARTYGAYLAFEPGGTGKGRFSDLAERALPGGETLFDDNYVRLGLANRSITSQVLLAADDLGYAANTSAVYRGAPFFANAVLMADTVRATASRLREDLARTLSLLTIGLRMNMTALNQADHCIVAQPAAGMGPLPTLDQPNQVLDAVQCGRLFPNRAAVGQFLVSVLAANAEPLGGTLSSDAFTAAELDTLGRQAGARALAQVNATQVATARVYQAEAARMTLKHGAGFPASVALNARSQADAETNRLLATSSETLTISTPTAPEGGSTFSGRLINDRGQGLADYRVALLRSNGTAVETLGVTDASGAFSAAYDSARTARLAKEGELFAQVSDLAGREVLRDSTALRFDTGAALQATLVMPVRVVPKSVVVDATLIYGTPAASAPTSPKPTPEPPPRVRTPLDRLELDDATRNQLAASGIRDVEGIVETSPKTLARILGGAEQAEKLTGMAKQALAQTPPPKPTAPGRAARTTAKKPTPRKR